MTGARYSALRALYFAPDHRLPHNEIARHMGTTAGSLSAGVSATRELRAIPGVADVTVSGGVKRELTVNLDPVRLQAAGVSVPEVVQARLRRQFEGQVFEAAALQSAIAPGSGRFHSDGCQTGFS